ncbi:MAG: hypothetical protein ACOC5T_05875 [Elusimicrobiota bacterium]
MNTIIELTYNKTKLSALKEEIKTLAEEIRQTKPVFKNFQRQETGRIEMSRGGFPYWLDTTPREILEKEWKIQTKLTSLQFQFRHKLIAYSLTKGKKYEQIEKTVREDNEPNWNFIRSLQDELTS